jgi:formate hydrogenlyase subunit 6/NADH:ubiquinone oxidoreductase subunit I
MVFMIPVVIKNLLSRSATRPYPRTPRRLPPGVRGQLVNDAEKCILCGACARKCPSQCLTVKREEGLWQCDPFACVYCGNCVEVCPTGSLSQLRQWRPATGKREMIVVRVAVRDKDEVK